MNNEENNLEKQKTGDNTPVKDNNTKTKNSNQTKILIAVIAVLFLAVIGLIVYIATNKNKKDNSTTEVTTVTYIATEESQTNSDASVSQNQDDDSDSSACQIHMTLSNSWEGEGYFGQLDTKIVNNSGTDLKNWSIKVEVPDGLTIDSNWNCEYEFEGNTLTITPVDFNSTITAGGSVSDVGIIVNAESISDIESVCSRAVLYVGGKEYISDSTIEDDSTTEEQETAEEQEAQDKPETEDGTPVDNHGKLSVDGTDLVDNNGEKYQLKGVSTHGLSWFPDYINTDTFRTFRDDWDANVIRLAMYTAENGGYCTDGDQSNLKGLVNSGVDIATELGMYVIIDWHVLRDENPQTYKSQAIDFFDEMSAKYAEYDNVIYEICNEPNGSTTWADVKSYAEEVIPVIRANSPNSIIIVGTPTWSQDADIAAQDPITGYENIMYAVHFYATTHTDNIRNKVTTALDAGLPIFISEFSICDASGNGAIDYDQAEKWMTLIADKNLSYCAWNISNKAETSSLISSSCTKLSGWTDNELSETGIWLKGQLTGN